MPNRRSLFVGRSGEYAVLSEFLIRGYNTAVPDIDIGEDVFVIEDQNQDFRPVQIKTATTEPQPNGDYHAQFNFRRDQLVRTRPIELTYVLALRKDGNWGSFLLIPRVKLYEIYDSGKLGSQAGATLTWNFTYRAGRIMCQDADFTQFESAWDQAGWPSILNSPDDPP